MARRPRNATDDIYTTLRMQLMSGRFEPGSQLKEEWVADTMQVSRTPVRAAFQRLVGDGLLRSEVNRGVFVAEWTQRDIEEVFDLRVLMEPHAARLAARRASSADVDEMDRLTDRMEDLASTNFREQLNAIQETNHAFHAAILRASGSARLVRAAEQLISMPMIVGTFYFYEDRDMRNSIQHHRQVITGISAGEADLAADAMSTHLRVTNEIFKRNRGQSSNRSTC